MPLSRKSISSKDGHRALHRQQGRRGGDAGTGQIRLEQERDLDLDPDGEEARERHRVAAAEDAGGEHEAQHRLGHAVALLERGGGEPDLVAHHPLPAADQRLLELPLQRVGLLERQVRRELADRAHRGAAQASLQEVLDERGGHGQRAADRGSSRAVTVASTAAALPRITRSAWPSCGVSVRFTIARVAPACLACSGM